MNIERPDLADDAGVDLTPMIDVVFLLIAFFMVVTSMVTDELFEIKIPEAGMAKVPEDRSNRQNITVSDTGRIFYGAVELTEANEIIPYLTKANERANGSIQVYIRGDAGAEHQDIRDVMSACAASGVQDVIFSTNQE